ncbi:TRAP transporter substrate-binding protein [Stappia indica]|uniref:TRAP transporter substrate-binding protein n=1 Tax=Stappia indica TaxID=538381 RepID=UPI001CD5F05F|nr:TRAP transporter substrate-binding protein [Stappia indica]MCA1300542.1 TRAP transporter substrate-binding protein [Stappia indica]
MTELTKRQFLGLAAGAAALCAPSILRAAGPTKLRFTNFAGPTSFLTNGIFRPAFDAIEAASDGTLKIDIYSGGSLASAADTYDAVRRGIADMGWGVTSYTPGRFKTATLVELPFEALTSKSASQGLWKLYQEDLLDGFKGVEVFSVMSSGIQHCHSTKEIDSLDGLAGERVRAAGSTAAMMWEAFGAIPVSLPVSTIAESLSKNTLHGSMNDWNALETWGILDFVKWHIDVPLGSSPCFLTINKKVFDSLPEVAQTALREHGGQRFNDFWGEQLDGENRRLRAVVAEMTDHHILVPTAEQLGEWKKRIAPVTEKWVAENPNGERALELYTATLNEARG